MDLNSVKNSASQGDNRDNRSDPSFPDLARIFNLALEDLQKGQEEAKEICFNAILSYSQKLWI